MRYETILVAVAVPAGVQAMNMPLIAVIVTLMADGGLDTRVCNVITKNAKHHICRECKLDMLQTIVANNDAQSGKPQ